MPIPDDQHIIVVGAGVIGLTSALVLAEDGYKVTIVARDTPADMHSQAFASPWAGANWSNFGGDDLRKNAWEKRSFEKLSTLMDLGLVQKQRWSSYDLDKPYMGQKEWHEDFVSDVVRIPDDELLGGAMSGKRFTTISLAPATYLPWLLSELAKFDIQIIVKEVDSLSSALLEVPGATCVVNCTALGSATLKDVMDDKVYPIRGQTILVRCPWVKGGASIKNEGDDPIYVISRPDGLAVMGGTYHVGSSDLKVDEKRAIEILQQGYAIMPELSHGQGWEKIDVVRHNVGLRPGREGGARVETEMKQMGGKEMPVVHAYGIGGAGYQASWGIAENVLELVTEALFPDGEKL